MALYDRDQDRFPHEALDRWLTTPPEDQWDGEEDDMDDMDGEELTLKERNAARLQALNSIGIGVKGSNEALMMMMLKRWLGPSVVAEVEQEHQEWLAEQLDQMEGAVTQMQAKAEEERRKQMLMGRG